MVRRFNINIDQYCIFFPSPVPSPPIGLKADNIKATSMTISWQPPHNVNCIISGYQVSYTLHGESEWLHDVAKNTTSTELTGLRPHTEYTVRVRAKTVDYGEYSTPIKASTLEDGEYSIIYSMLVNSVTSSDLIAITCIYWG